MSEGQEKQTYGLSRSLDYLSKLCVFRSMDPDDSSSIEEELIESNVGCMTDSTMQCFISEVLNRFYKTEAFCDVHIHTNTFVIKAHSLILAAVSPYFRAQFSHLIRDPKCATKNVVKIPYDGEVIKDLINYIYTGKLEFTADNICLMMELQDFFQIGPLKFLISEFLNTSLDINNAWTIKREAEFRRYKDVAKNAFNFIKENFGTMIEQKDFLEVPYEQLKECLVSDHLAVPTEDRLLVALTSWVSHHPEERLPLLDSVLAKVEVSRIEDWKATARTVMDLFPDEVHRLSMATWLANAQLRRFSGETRAVDRYKQYASDVLLAIGGIQDKGKTSVGTIECLTALGEPWKPILSRWRGGRANNRPDQDSIVFPVMHTPRRHPSVASTGDTIYVLGGTPNGCELEVYKLKENKWFVLPSFPLGMDIPPAMALIDGHLYASGGLQKSWVIPSSHLWVLYEGSKHWRPLANMKDARTHHTMVALNGALFVLGGFGGGRVATATFEKYDPSLDVWVNLPSMNEPRAYHGCVPLGPHIYLLTHCAVQRYDTQKNIWETMCSSHTAKQDPDEPCPHPVECTRNSVYAAKLNKNLVLSRSRRESLQVYNCATNKSAVWPTLSLLKKTCVALTTIRVPLYSPPPV